jgi:hypothetical protein
MWLLSVSFIDDAERRCLGRPLMLDMPPRFDLGPAVEDLTGRQFDAAAVTVPPARETLSARHVYRCPVCGTAHEVNEARHRVAYGRQLTCSCACEIRRRKAVKDRWRNRRAGREQAGPAGSPVQTVTTRRREAGASILPRRRTRFAE